MNDPHQIAVRVQVLEGVWEQIGVDRLRGIMPENVQLSANEWGPDQCSFTLKGPPGMVRADLTAWTPIEVEVAGQVVWDGRIKETPTQDATGARSFNVQAEGWQYHLDDDVYMAAYVRSNLSEWQDVRSSVLAYLPSFTATPQVNGGTLQWANGTSTTLNECVGLLLDCGADPAGWAKRISVDWKSFADSSLQLTSRCADSPTVFTVAGGAVSGTNMDIAISTTAPTSGSSTQSGTFANARRYVSVFVYRNAAGGAVAADYGVTITGIRLYRDTAYESGNASVLKADTIIKDAAAKGAPLLSADLSGVQVGTFTISEHAPGRVSSREAWQGANAYENYDTRVEVGLLPVFRPRPTAALYEIGEWAGANFQDASVNSGQDIYNRAITEGTGPDGASLTAERSSGDVSLSSPLLPITSPQFANGEFEVDVAGWTGSTTPTRTTTAGEFISGSAGLKWVGADDATLRYAFPVGTFQAGTTYVIQALAKASVGGVGWKARFGVTPTTPGADWAAVPASPATWDLTTTFKQYTIPWTPRATVTTAVELVLIGVGTASYFLDAVELRRAAPTIVDRRGFRRTKILPVGAAITSAVGQRISDLFLAAHATTPFRGGMQTVGQGGVRRVLGGQSPHPARLLLDTTQLVRCPVIDTDTGDWTRDARMVGVTYDHDALSASIALDEDREGFDTLLARYALVVSQPR